MEQYFELYRTTSLRLKKEFPDIHVGGYASCGFYAVTGDRTTEFYKSFVTWFHDFLQFVTDSKTQCPFDFFSWHLYTGIPEKIVAHANYVDAKLKEFGLDKTENIFNEWNYTSKNPQRRFLEMKDNEGASFVSAAFCLMQPSPIDKAMYYDAYPQRSYCGLYHFPGRRTTQTYTAFKMWNQLYRLGKQCATASDQKSLYSCAAANKGQKALLITNFSSKGCRLSIQMKGAKLKDFSARIIDRRHDGAPFALTEEIALPPYSTLLLTTQQSEMQALPSSKSPTNHAGLASN